MNIKLWDKWEVVAVLLESTVTTLPRNGCWGNRAPKPETGSLYLDVALEAGRKNAPRFGQVRLRDWLYRVLDAAFRGG